MNSIEEIVPGGHMFVTKWDIARVGDDRAVVALHPQSMCVDGGEGHPVMVYRGTSAPYAFKVLGPDARYPTTAVSGVVCDAVFTAYLGSGLDGDGS